MDRFTKPAFCIVLAFITLSDQSVEAQRVFSNSRAAASARPPRQSTATGGFSTGRSSGARWGIPGRPSSSDWTLRPPSSSRSSSTQRYSTPRHQRGTIQYSVPSPIIHYSPFIGPQPYGNYGGPVIYGAPAYGYNNYGLSPYDQARIQNGLPSRYSNAYGASPSIATPQVTIPYGGPAPHSQPADNFLPPVPETNGATYSKKISTDERPITNEFQVQPPIDFGKSVSTVDRIRSLRYQTSGDGEFRQQEFAAAATLYEASAKTAPDRRAPWIRKAWAAVSQQQFDEAARSLTLALQLPDDPTNSWIPGEQLYGSKFAVDAALLNEPLWRWLQERPNSTDRLLLVAGFQHLQGYAGTARELINAALQKGLQQNIVDAFEQIINDRAGPAVQPESPTPQIQDSYSIGNMPQEIGAPVAIEADTLGTRTFTAPQTLDAQPIEELPLLVPEQ